MNFAAFVPANLNLWKEYKQTDCSIWIAGNHTDKEIKNLVAKLSISKVRNINYLKKVLNEINYHFGIIFFSEKCFFAAVDCARTYPVFWRQKKNKLLLSSNAKTISFSHDKIDNQQLLAFQMSGYTIDEGCIWKNIYNINPGCFIFADELGHIHSKKYFLYKPWKNNNKGYNTLNKELKKEIFGLIKGIIKKAKGKCLVVPLSAGLDSRLIVSGLKHFNYKNVKCFSYGLKKNYESIGSEIISNKLGYPWKYVEINQKNAKAFYKTRVFKNFISNTVDGCATPSIQGLMALDVLLKTKFISQQDIIINGNSGDFISGGHIPKMPKKLKRKNSIIGEILDIHINKHYALWEKLLNNRNKKIIKAQLKLQLEKQNINQNKNFVPLGIAEFLEFQNRQAKYVVNCQRVYDFFNLNWMLPLWNKSFVNFWSTVPLKYKKDQLLYKKVLEEINMGEVWVEKYKFKFYLKPDWIRIIRLPLKALFFFFGKEKWYKFEKRFISYWTCNVCGQSFWNYNNIIKNPNGARHYVSWYTLLSENIALEKNWQKIKFNFESKFLFK